MSTRFAVFHHLPTGGALRVLAEWLRRTAVGPVTIYTPDPSVHRFVDLDERASVVQVSFPRDETGFGAFGSLLRAGAAGRDIARRIDAAGHDGVLVFPSRLTQAPTMLDGLLTPHIYYAPEVLRSAYEKPSLMVPGRGVVARLTRAGLNPIEHLRRHVDRRAIRQVRTVVTHSHFTADELARVYAKRATVIPLGVDAHAFQPTSRSSREKTNSRSPYGTDAAPYVLAIGAFHPLKAHDFVLDAVAQMGGTLPRIVVVGDRGEGAETLAARAMRLGVSLEIYRDLRFEALVDLMRGAAVVVCPQIREPFGLVPLEAMAAGRPVVAVDEGGFRETIVSGTTGLLVPRNARAFGAAIRQVLDDPELAQRLGHAGRDSATRVWTWERHARLLDAALREVAE